MRKPLAPCAEGRSNECVSAGVIRERFNFTLAEEVACKTVSGRVSERDTSSDSEPCQCIEGGGCKEALGFASRSLNDMNNTAFVFVCQRVLSRWWPRG